MTETQDKVPTVMEKVKEVNRLLKDGEPGNVSVDSYAGYSGYKPQSVIDCMNAVMFGDWGFEVISTEFAGKNDKGEGPTLALATVKVWIKELEFQPTADGQSRITKGDLGDAKKGAQTDALKKALSYFSIGNRAYHGVLEGKKK